MRRLAGRRSRSRRTSRRSPSRSSSRRFATARSTPRRTRIEVRVAALRRTPSSSRSPTTASPMRAAGGRRRARPAPADARGASGGRAGRVRRAAGRALARAHGRPATTADGRGAKATVTTSRSACSSSTTTTSSTGAFACCSSASRGSSAAPRPATASEALELAERLRPTSRSSTSSSAAESGTELTEEIRRAPRHEGPADLRRRHRSRARSRRRPARRGSSPRTGARPTSSRPCAWSRWGWRSSARSRPQAPPRLTAREREVLARDRRRGDQPRDRRAPLPLPAHDQGAHELDLPQARGPQPRRGRPARPAARADRLSDSAPAPPPARPRSPPDRGVEAPGGLTSRRWTGKYPVDAHRASLSRTGQPGRRHARAGRAPRARAARARARRGRRRPVRARRTRAPPTRSRRSSARASPRWIARRAPARRRSSPATRSASSARSPPPARSSPPTRSASRSIRGRLMQDAAATSRAAMLALLGDGRAGPCGRGARAGSRSPTTTARPSSSSPGPREALDAAASEAKARGVRSDAAAGRRRLPHRRRWSPRSSPSARRSTRSSSRRRSAPVFSSTTAEPFAARAAAIRDQLAAALVSPVRWRETLDALHRRGVRSFVEAGPGKALTGMVRRAFDDVEATVLGASRRRPMPEATIDPSRAAARQRRRPSFAAPPIGRRSASRVPRDGGRPTRRSPRASASSEDWIVARTGVRERRVAAAGEGVAELARRGRRPARSRRPAPMPAEVDLVLVATMSHDHLTPERRAAGRRADRRAACRGDRPRTRPAPDSSRRSRSPPRQIESRPARDGARHRRRRAQHGSPTPTIARPPRCSATAPAPSSSPPPPATGRIGPAVLGADGARQRADHRRARGGA